LSLLGIGAAGRKISARNKRVRFHFLKRLVKPLMKRNQHVCYCQYFVKDTGRIDYRKRSGSTVWRVTAAGGTSAGTTFISLTYPRHLFPRRNSAECHPSIIGATQNRWDRLGRAIFVSSVTCCTFVISLFAPVSADFDPVFPVVAGNFRTSRLRVVPHY
jgi:hypothetical protein